MQTGYKLAMAAALSIIGGAAQAGDPAGGETGFKRCVSCHGIVADDGTTIVRGGKTGPNLYGVIGRTIGTAADYSYGDSLVAAGEAGLVWDEESLAAYITDPNAWLAEALDDPSARSKMTYKHRKGAEDVAAYLASLEQS